MNPARKGSGRSFFLIFIAVPLVEMLLLFEVSGQIGGLNTLALVVLTAVIGVQILKRQGLSTLLRANQRLASGQLPAQEIVEGMLLASAGALLLTPGFITDTLGFVFLTGPLRRPMARRIVRSGVVRAAGGSSQFSFFTASGRGQSRSHGPRGGGDVFEGEYSDESRPPLDDNGAGDDDQRHQ